MTSIIKQLHNLGFSYAYNTGSTRAPTWYAYKNKNNTSLLYVRRERDATYIILNKSNHDVAYYVDGDNDRIKNFIAAKPHLIRLDNIDDLVYFV